MPFHRHSLPWPEWIKILFLIANRGRFGDVRAERAWTGEERGDVVD
jgi:hypothetical protein